MMKAIAGGAGARVVAPASAARCVAARTQSISSARRRPKRSAGAETEYAATALPLSITGAATHATPSRNSSSSTA